MDSITNILKKDIDNYIYGYTINIYNNSIEKEYIYGNSIVKPYIKKVDDNTLYDIASLTKTYTATIIYMAYEEGKIDIYKSVYDIDNNYVNLKNVRIIDLLSHNQNIWTKGYLGDAKTKEEFYNILYSSYVKDKTPTYVDVHYIILSNIIEKIFNKSFDDICNEKIFKPLNLINSTFYPEKERCASNNFENNNNNIVDYIYPGLIHDTKARTAKELGIITGHASLFTTGHDLLVFLYNLFFTENLIKKDTLNLMLEHNDFNIINYNNLHDIYKDDNDINIMYNKYKESNYNINIFRTYNNMSVRYKNNINALNDVPINASSASLTFSGYTGPFYVIDIERNIIFTFMCNHMHNTNLSRSERKDKSIMIANKIYDYIIFDKND